MNLHIQSIKWNFLLIRKKKKGEKKGIFQNTNLVIQAIAGFQIQIGKIYTWIGHVIKRVNTKITCNQILKKLLYDMVFPDCVNKD